MSPVYHFLPAARENINRPVQILIGQTRFHLPTVSSLSFSRTPDDSPKDTYSTSSMPCFSVQRRKQPPPRTGRPTALAGPALYSGPALQKCHKNYFHHALICISGFSPRKPFKSMQCQLNGIVSTYFLCSPQVFEQFTPFSLNLPFLKIHQSEFHIFQGKKKILQVVNFLLTYKPPTAE